MKVILICLISTLIVGQISASFIDIEVANECWNRNNTRILINVCRKDMSSFWEVDFTNDSATENNIHGYCCAHYMYFGCLKKVAKSQCFDQRKEIAEPYEASEALLTALVCGKDYLTEAWMCALPIWVPILIIMLVLGTVCVMAIFIRRLLNFGLTKG